jgi:hypothetical protein
MGFYCSLHISSSERQGLDKGRAVYLSVEHEARSERAGEMLSIGDLVEVTFGFENFSSIKAGKSFSLLDAKKVF